MKFVRVFALLLALIAVLDAGQDILNLLVFDISDEADLFWFAAIKGVVALAFGVGAYVLTTNEDT